MDQDKFKEYKFKAMEFMATRGVPNDIVKAIDCRFYENAMTDLYFESIHRVYGRQKKNFVRIPRTWFDMWLIQRCPKCISKFFNINYLELSVKETAIIPGANVPHGEEYFVLTEVENVF